MRVAVCVTPLAKNIPIIENADYIGVDAGALRILEQNLPLAYATGDFDSMRDEDLEKLKSICEVEIHPVMKDETDSELAILNCLDSYDEIILYGAFGGRLDHTLLNIRLMTQKFPSVILMDETQKMTYLQQGIHTISDKYKNISFLPMEKSVITLSGFLYSISNRTIEMKDTYTTSNSLVDQKGIVTIHSGSLICIQTNEK